MQIAKIQMNLYTLNPLLPISGKEMRKARAMASTTCTQKKPLYGLKNFTNHVSCSQTKLLLIILKESCVQRL